MNIRIVPILAAALVALAGCGGSLATADKADWPVTTETATAPAPEPPAPEWDIVERAYLAALDSEGVRYSSPEAAITAGRAVCTYLDNTAPVYGEHRALIEAGRVAMDNGYSEWHAGTIVGAAVGSWCPEYAGGDW